MKFTRRLVAGLSAVLCVVLAVAVGGAGVLRAAPQLPTGMSAMVGDGFVDLSHEIGRVGTVVAIGNLTGIRDGKKERLDEKDRGLGEGGSKVSIAGTVFFRVACTGKFAIQTPLHGAPGAKSMTLRFDIQLATLPDGTKDRRFLLPDSVRCEDDMLALVVARPDDKTKRGDPIVRQVLRFDAAIDKGADPQKAFHARATDVFRVAARKVELEETIEAAKFAHRQGRTADAKKLIDRVLEKKVDLVDPTHRGWLSRAVTPLEQAARELRESFDAPK